MKNDKNMNQIKNLPGELENSLKELIISKSKKGRLSCEKAFEIALIIKVMPAIVGYMADKLNIRFAKCQLGLFGYKPQKKILKPASNINSDIMALIEKKQKENCISCKNIWEIASLKETSKIDVASLCERLKLKIKSCQLGAF